MRVQVYWNFNRKVWSVRDARTRRVIGHASELLLSRCTMKVSEAGRQRVLREKRKNVHAYIEGFLETMRPTATWEPIGYNPYKGETFTLRESGCPIVASALAKFDPDGKAFVHGRGW